MRISEYEIKQRQDAERRRREREEEEVEYYRMESLGIQPQSVPTGWLRGEYG